MKNLIEKTFAVALITLIVSCSLIPALATTLPPPDINAKTTRIESLEVPAVPDSYGDPDCRSTQSISATSLGTDETLFVIRVESKNADDENSETNTSEDDLAMLYMYEDYSTMSNKESDKYGTILLRNLVGHANGMAIDDEYLYVTCWDNDKNDGNYNERKIVRISIDALWNIYNDDDVKDSIFKGELTANSGGVTILPVLKSNGSVFTEKIVGISYFRNGKFFINLEATTDGDTYYLNFTKAEISDNGTPSNDQDDYLIVSDSATDKFQVVFNDAPNTFGQDIGYDPDCGLFIVRSYKEKITYVDENGEEKEKYVPTTENVIIWIRLDSLTGANRVYRNDNSSYRIINVNKSSNIFDYYELESVSIGSDNNMYACVNVLLSDSSYKDYKRDPIIKITRPDGSKFLGINILN